MYEQNPTKIDQSEHGDSEQLLVELHNQGWMLQVGMKWEPFH
jgi:hypothetical protein